MANWIVTLDPTSVLPKRTELSLNSETIMLDQTGVDWGTSELRPFLSEQRYGEQFAEWRVPNRTVTIPMAVGTKVPGTEAEEEKARRELQEKVALIQRQGGVLKRQREGGEALYADIVTATLTVPDKFAEKGTIEPNVVLVLTCLPDFYGEETILAAVTGVGQIVAVLESGGKPAVIAGDYPARARIIVTEKSKNNQRGLFWGLRSRYYDSAATAKLFYDAVELTTINGATGVTKSGTYSGKAVELAQPQVETWHPFLEMKVAAGEKSLTHLGSYRVWARVQIRQILGKVRLQWSNDDASAPTTNAAVSLTFTTPYEEWQLADLGIINIEEPPVGEHFWQGTIQVEFGATSNPALVDRIWFQPIDDGTGRLRASANPVTTLLQGSLIEPVTVATSHTLHVGEVAWTNPERAKRGKTLQESAEVKLAAGQISDALVATKFGFKFPATAVIKGLEVRIAGGGAYEVAPTPTVQVLKNETTEGTTLKQSRWWGFIEPYNALGSSSDLWGTTWTPAQVEALGFGWIVWLIAISAGTMTVVSFKARVYYSYSASAVTQDAVLYSERKAELRFDGAYREDVASAVYTPITEELGDLVRIPPSGLEKRETQLLIKNSRGLLPSVNPPSQENDTSIDNIEAQVKYRPCYIGRI